MDILISAIHKQTYIQTNTYINTQTHTSMYDITLVSVKCSKISL